MLVHAERYQIQEVVAGAGYDLGQGSVEAGRKTQRFDCCQLLSDANRKSLSPMVHSACLVHAFYCSWPLLTWCYTWLGYVVLQQENDVSLLVNAKSLCKRVGLAPQELGQSPTERLEKIRERMQVMASLDATVSGILRMDERVHVIGGALWLGREKMGIDEEIVRRGLGTCLVTRQPCTKFGRQVVHCKQVEDQIELCLQTEEIGAGHGGGWVSKGWRYKEAKARWEKVAVKTAYWHAAATLENEVTMLNQLHHERPVTGVQAHPSPETDCLSSSGVTAYIMQYYQSDAAGQVWKNACMEYKIHAMYWPLIGLGAMHERGVIHGDIKPDNILFDQQQRICVLADLGLAFNAHVEPMPPLYRFPLHYTYWADVWQIWWAPRENQELCRALHRARDVFGMGMTLKQALLPYLSIDKQKSECAALIHRMTAGDWSQRPSIDEVCERYVEIFFPNNICASPSLGG